MAAFGYQRINVNVRVADTTSTPAVPNDCFAKLMYYLDCVDSCLPGIIPTELKTYQLYYTLDKDLKEQLVSWAVRLPPIFFDNLVFFHIENMDSNNKFLEISVARRTIAGVPLFGGTALIDGQRVSVSKVMLYKTAWVRKYYGEALASASRKLADNACCIIM